jgi:hypothetical protein
MLWEFPYTRPDKPKRIPMKIWQYEWRRPLWQLALLTVLVYTLLLFTLAHFLDLADDRKAQVTVEELQ